MKLFKTAAERFVNESGTLRTPASVTSFMKVMRTCQRSFPDHHVTDFTGIDLTTFCLSRADGKDGNPAPATIKHRKSYLISFFEWAAYMRLIQSNPAVDLKFTVKPGGGHVRLGNWLTETEAAEIFRSFDVTNQKDRRDRLVFLIGVTLGLRVFEIAALRWDRFSEDFSALRIKGKGDKIVDMTVPPQLRRELLAWYKERPMGASHVVPAFRWHFNPGKGKRVLVPLWDKPLSDEAYRYIVKTCGDRIGRKLTPHDLRRSFAGILQEKGVELKEIQLALRHSNLSTTDRYLSSNPARLEKLMGGMNWDFD